MDDRTARCALSVTVQRMMGVINIERYRHWQLRNQTLARARGSQLGSTIPRTHINKYTDIRTNYTYAHRVLELYSMHMKKKN